MDPNQAQYYAYMNYLQNQSSSPGDNSQSSQYFMHPPRPPTNHPMWYPPPTGTNSNVEPPSIQPNQPGSPTGSMPESEMPQFSTQVGMENITLTEDKRSRFTDADDILLVQTWLNISKDPIVGVDQKADSFWAIIRDNYNNYREQRIARKAGALKSRWHKMNVAVQKFCGCYKTAVVRNTSGKSENDVLAEAFKLYSQTAKGSFKFEHAWRLLRDEPKWKGESMNNSSKRSKTGDGTYSSSSNPEMPINREDTYAGNFDYDHTDNDISTAEVSHGPEPNFTTLFERVAHVHERQNHRQLQADLVEHIWERFGHENN